LNWNLRFGHSEDSFHTTRGTLQKLEILIESRFNMKKKGPVGWEGWACGGGGEEKQSELQWLTMLVTTATTAISSL